MPKFLEPSLQGVKTDAQIRVAAADMLASEAGYKRTVCIVKANGLRYKVKCSAKMLSYTSIVTGCKIVDKRVA